MGLGELQRLVSSHLPQRPPQDFQSLDRLEQDFDLGEGAGRVNFSIPGFQTYGCNACHQGEDLLGKSAERMKNVLARLKSAFPESAAVPFKQYIIQPWADELLAPRQFAHATFDTIRVFPRTILIDSHVYGNATHLHESLHLTQRFVGAPNELEAYGLNIRSDPRFLFLNYPYFADVLTAFFLADFPRMLNEFFARAVKEDLDVSREVQWFMNPFDDSSLRSVSGAVEGMEPVLSAASRIIRDKPVQASYLSEQTGDVSLLLEIAAVAILPLPELTVSDEMRSQAFVIFDTQMRKTDNTRLGYKIDRKNEILLTWKHLLKMDDPLERLRLYFYFLKERFVGPGGDVRLVVEDKEDLVAYGNRELDKISRLAQFERLTPVEKKAAADFIESIKKELRAL